MFQKLLSEWFVMKPHDVYKTQRNFIVKNAVSWVVTPYGSCKNGRFGRT
jgi:hypothetical protein